MRADFDLIVSAENRLYMAWQTQLLCYSALTRLNLAPTVIVHGTGVPLLEAFSRLRDLGCRVIEAPSFVTTPAGQRCRTRNTVGTLLTAAGLVELVANHILLCDPDMLFVGSPEYEEGLSGEFYSYVRYDGDAVRQVLNRWGAADLSTRLNRTSRVGAPYLVPRPVAGRLARRWLKVLDAFPSTQWIDLMFAFGIAAALERMDVQSTHAMQCNDGPDRELFGALIHYCYGDEVWDKRRFERISPLELGDANLTRGRPGSIMEEMMRQLREARDFYAREARGARHDKKHADRDAGRPDGESAGSLLRAGGLE